MPSESVLCVHGSCTHRTETCNVLLQGWIPVMPSSWMTMYGGHMMAPGPPMSPHMGPAGSGPDSYPFAAPWSGRPGNDAGDRPSLACQSTWQSAAA